MTSSALTLSPRPFGGRRREARAAPTAASYRCWRGAREAVRASAARRPLRPSSSSKREVIDLVKLAGLADPFAVTVSSEGGVRQACARHLRRARDGLASRPRSARGRITCPLPLLPE